MLKALPRWTPQDEALRHIQCALKPLIDARDYGTVERLALLASQLQRDIARKRAQ